MANERQVGAVFETLQIAVGPSVSGLECMQLRMSGGFGELDSLQE